MENNELNSSYAENAPFWVKIIREHLDRYRLELTNKTVLDAIGPIEEDSLTRPFDPSRRSTLRRLVETGGFAVTALPLLLDQGKLEISNRVLDAVLPHLMEIAPKNREAANLAVHGLGLRSIICAHLLQLNEKVASCQEAVRYAGLSGDPSVLAAALTKLAASYRYTHNPVQLLETCEAGLQSCGQASPLLRSYLYSISAAAYGQAGRASEAKHYISRAYEVSPTAPERDPHYMLADVGLYVIAFYEGIMHLELGQPIQADRALESYLQHPSASFIPERWRLEIVNQQARAAIHNNDLDKYILFLDNSLKGSLAIKSQKRFDEALTIYRQELPEQWRQEPAVKYLAEQYQLATTTSIS